MNFKTKDTFPLANLSINSKYLVFNSCHSFCDGVFLTRILNQIQNPIKPMLPLFPTPVVVNFKDQIAKADVIQRDYRDPQITHLENVTTKSKDPTDIFQNHCSKFDSKSLTCYENGKISDLTNQFASSMILASKALSNFVHKIVKI